MKKTTYKEKEVVLNRNGNNADIIVTLLPDEKMREAGFTDFAEDRWYYSRYVNGRKDITFNITIPKKDPKDWRIDVLDEDFCQPFDYQYMIEKGHKSPVLKEVFENVEDQMKYLADAGIISGHRYGEYI